MKIDSTTGEVVSTTSDVVAFRSMWSNPFGIIEVDLSNEEEEILYICEIIPLLNSLYDENEQLRQSLEHMISKATEISNRNVLLHEEIGKLTRQNKELGGND